MKVKHIHPADRPWAGKRFQNVLGVFHEHDCGLFLSSDVSAKNVSRIVQAFRSAPLQLVELAREHELTLNVSYLGSTSNDNVCTIYGVADGVNVSPHLEIGRSAFGPDLAPYIVHELCHLYWRVLPDQKRRKYRRFLVESTDADEREVTEYAQSKFEAYLEHKSRVGKLKNAELYLEFLESVWVVESFCETVAMLRVPEYKSEEDWQATVNLKKRGKAIREIVDLRI